MNQFNLIMLVCLAASAAGAKEYKLDRKVLPHKLQNELAAAGFPRTRVACQANDCVLDIIGEASSSLPSRARAVVAAHDPVDQERARIKALAGKWKAGTISAAEKDELLKIMVLQYFGLRPD